MFALANPEPEVDPDEAREHAAVIATGRSDYPNQINNVLAFPGVFRGLLDAQSRTITDGMLVAAARALADVVTPDEIGPNYIIPSVFHPDVASAVAAAVREAASGPHPAAAHSLGPGSSRAGPKVLNGDHDGHMDEMATDSLTGCLLVATPVLADPNFRRTVVLIVEHEPSEGTLGVVLNRPTDVPVGQVLESVVGSGDGPFGGFQGRPGRPEQRPGDRLRAGRRGTARLAFAGGHRGHVPARAGRPGRAP